MPLGMKTTLSARTRQKKGTSPVPYLQVKQHLVHELSKGRWAPGERMPSEAQLVAQFAVSRMTVNRALRELQAQGLVDRVQGAGTFAAALHPVSSSLTIRDLHQEITERGHVHHAHVETVQEEKAGTALAERLGLRAGAKVFHTLIVHFENGVPLQCEDRYVNPACAPNYLEVDFTQTTPTHYLLQVAPLWQAQYNIEAGLATAQEARLLRIEPREPCLVLVRRTLSRGAVITLARLVHPGLRYRLQGEFSP
jgi:GntR family transcriptional regulator, histidine utilization repressor